MAELGDSAQIVTAAAGTVQQSFKGLTFFHKTNIKWNKEYANIIKQVFANSKANPRNTIIMRFVQIRFAPVMPAENITQSFVNNSVTTVLANLENTSHLFTKIM